MPKRYDAILDDTPLIAILRGITPEEAPAVADALMEAGFRMLEVPLNSPRPFESIARLAGHCPPDVLVGAGTVLEAAQVERLAEILAPLLVTPNTDPTVIDAAVRHDLLSVIGCFTPSEALLALKHGARVLKVFPAARLGPEYLRDIRAVLPEGADIFAFGSNLYRPGRSAAEVGAIARDLVAEYQRLPRPAAAV